MLSITNPDILMGGRGIKYLLMVMLIVHLLMLLIGQLLMLIVHFDGMGDIRYL